MAEMEVSGDRRKRLTYMAKIKKQTNLYGGYKRNRQTYMAEIKEIDKLIWLR